jgi:hypothetical protein
VDRTLNQEAVRGTVPLQVGARIGPLLAPGEGWSRGIRGERSGAGAAYSGAGWLCQCELDRLLAGGVRRSARTRSERRNDEDLDARRMLVGSDTSSP